jgi:hypothetical protein
MKASFHIVGCAVAREPAAGAMDECLDWLRRHGAEALAHNERELVFVKFDAADAALVDFGCRTAARHRPPLLRFGFASGIKEGTSDGQPRLGERGIVQACDLAGAAQPGQVLLSSQLGSLLQVAQIEPASRLRSLRVSLLDGRSASAYTVEPRRRAAATG